VLLLAFALQRFPLEASALVRVLLSTLVGLAALAVAAVVSAPSVKIVATIAVVVAAAAIAPRLLAAARAGRATT
jgi:hypothetical protein